MKTHVEYLETAAKAAILLSVKPGMSPEEVKAAAGSELELAIPGALDRAFASWLAKQPAAFWTHLTKPMTVGPVVIWRARSITGTYDEVVGEYDELYVVGGSSGVAANLTALAREVNGAQLPPMFSADMAKRVHNLRVSLSKGNGSATMRATYEAAEPMDASGVIKTSRFLLVADIARGEVKAEEPKTAGAKGVKLT